jgi:hypothetical protein
MSDEEDWDDFAEDAARASRRPGPACAVGAMLNRIPIAAVDGVEKALANRALSNPAIRAALTRRLPGKEVPSRWAIGYHRRGDCGCNRKDQASE